ncbi:MAG: PEP-CTERM sorting domain-containing protein [Luteolibacter sp.]
MKTKAPLIAALSVALSAAASAFTLDAIGYEGQTLPVDPVVINVPGYGDLIFQADPGSSLVVGSDYQNDNGFGGPSLNFNQGESVRITFAGSEAINVDFDFVGVSANEGFSIEQDPANSQSYVLTLNGSGDGAGLYAISWNTVPEPTSALMGVLGGAMLAFRRRR